MMINLIAIGTRLDLWAQEGFKTYHRRFPSELKLNVITLPICKRNKNSLVSKCIEEEGKRILAAIPNKSQVIALDKNGQLWNTDQLTQKLRQLQLEQKNISLLIGGPDGLSLSCLKRAELSWSLSPLTFPHPLVRIMVAEQLYRAFSLLRGHPYHRK